MLFKNTLLCLGSLLALSWLAGCASHSAVPQHKNDPVRIGALLPFSGGVELYGQQAKLGLDLAAKEINESGGILGHPVELVYVDDHTHLDHAVKAAHRLVDHDKVFAVVGPITSQNLKGISPILAKEKVPLLYATNYEGGVRGRYVFALSTVPNQELSPLLPYMNEHFGKTYYLLGADRVWPHQMFAVAEPLIAKLGGRVVGKEYTLGAEKDFTPIIQRIKASKAKVLLFALKGPGLDFVNQARDQGLFKQVTVAFLGLSEIELPIFKGKGNNSYVVVPFVASSQDPKCKDFVARIKANAGRDVTVSNLSLTHYNAMLALKAALEKAGKFDREAMINALEGLTIQSPTGPMTIGKDHHATLNLFLVKSDTDHLVTVEKLGEIKAKPGDK